MSNLTPYNNYQLSAIGVGVIATGLSDIRQCIDFILRTIPGSDPLRPLFGCNIYRYSDAPTNTKIPNMKLTIYEALELWEPRIRVNAITHELKKENVLFNITYQITDSDLLDTYEWAVNGGTDTNTNPSGIILSAIIPAKITNGHYNISLNINGAYVYPSPPVMGFDTATEMLEWVTANWQVYGNWYLTADKIVLYLNNSNVSKANLSVTQDAILTIKTFIPILNLGSFYTLVLTLDGVIALPEFPANTIATVEQLLQWLTSNYSDYGTWAIQNNGVIISLGDFNEDFNNDFYVGGVEPQLYLVFQTKKYNQATLTLN